MNIVSVILARGGSKGIPGKNIIDLNGKPLLYYSMRASMDSNINKPSILVRLGCLLARLSLAYLSIKKPRVLAHIGSRGTAYWNVRLLCHLFDFEEVRIHSKREESNL